MVRRFAIGSLLLAVGLSAQDKKPGPKMEHYDFHPLMQQIWDAWGTLDPANVARFYFEGCATGVFRRCAAEIYGVGRVCGRGEEDICRLFVGEVCAYRNVEGLPKAELCLGVGDGACGVHEEGRRQG